jgi:hypothetical protein
MAASKLRCCVCRAPFYGRSDACYCSAACRQKANRVRAACRTVTRRPLRQSRDAALHARQLRKRAQLARKEAVLIRREAAALRDSYFQ